MGETADADPVRDVISTAEEAGKEIEDEEFECLLGANGEVVLWSSRWESTTCPVFLRRSSVVVCGISVLLKSLTP